jgi:hypothetical protein
MSIPLEDAFGVFFEEARDALRGTSAGDVMRGTMRVVTGAARVEDVVKSLEETAEFARLAEATKSVFRGERHGEGGWREAVGHWFRRSEVYARLAANETPDPAVEFERFRAAFLQEEIEVTYLALMEYVYFAEERMDFGSFSVRRMTKEELEAILQNRTRADFYKWARVPLDGLADYWWLVAKEKQPRRAIGKIRFDFISSERWRS